MFLSKADVIVTGENFPIKSDNSSFYPELKDVHHASIKYKPQVGEQCKSMTAGVWIYD